jgi:hypothetical protein
VDHDEGESAGGEHGWLAVIGGDCCRMSRLSVDAKG